MNILKSYLIVAFFCYLYLCLIIAFVEMFFFQNKSQLRPPLYMIVTSDNNTQNALKLEQYTSVLLSYGHLFRKRVNRVASCKYKTWMVMALLEKG